MRSYNSPKGAQQYIDFINSDSGKIEQEILPPYILKALGSETGQAILDAGCGTGWLTAVLAKKYKTAVGCDASAELVNYAKQTCPGHDFIVHDVTRPLPFPDANFGAIVANMSLHDVENVPEALVNFYKCIKPGGKLILTISNPYYSLPVGVWKRSFLGRLFLDKPRLVLRSYYWLKRMGTRRFSWGDNITSHFYTLPEYINWAQNAGFQLQSLTDIEAEKDSEKFNLQYQLYRYPYILMLAFIKDHR